MRDFRTNNFDLIRLGAALQVAIEHTQAHFHLGNALGPVSMALSAFPGVPIFFIVSGMLISRSLEQSPTLRDYLRNRCLRIFPALWVCLVITVLVTAWLLVARLGTAGTWQWLAFWSAQMSVAQFWQPSFVQGLPTGGMNGSLWTITVELQFYLLLPLIYRLPGLRQQRGNVSLLLLAVVSLLVYLAITLRQSWFANWNYFSLTAFTLAPYLWIFLLGVLVQRNLARLGAWFAGKLPHWLLAYAAVTLLAHHAGWRVSGNAINPLSLIVLAGTVAAAAFSMRELAERLLRRNDLSYGIYIYHAPVLNLMLAGAFAPASALPACIGISILLAAASWWLVEKPFQARKRHPLRAVSATGTGTIA